MLLGKLHSRTTIDSRSKKVLGALSNYKGGRRVVEDRYLIPLSISRSIYS